MGYSFTDLGAEGCRRSLNALLKFLLYLPGITELTKMTSYVLQVSRQLGSLMDLYTTFINMAGKQIPSDRVVDGIDLTSVLFSQKQTDRLVCCTELIPGLCPANERWRYFVTTSLIG